MNIHPTTPEAVAHHEAGHAVASILNYAPFRYVTIRPRTAETAGLIMRHHNFRQDLHAHATIGIAGPHAESVYISHLHGQDRTKEVFAALIGTDDFDAYKSLIEIYGDEHAVNVAADAIVMVHNNWPAIQRVAAALLERKTLTQKDVLTTLG